MTFGYLSENLVKSQCYTLDMLLIFLKRQSDITNAQQTCNHTLTILSFKNIYFKDFLLFAVLNGGLFFKDPNIHMCEFGINSTQDIPAYIQGLYKVYNSAGVQGCSRAGLVTNQGRRQPPQGSIFS